MSVFPNPFIGPSYGVALPGVFVGSIVYGSTIMQLIHYFRTFRSDGIRIRGLVLFTFGWDSIQLGILLYLIYQVTITHWGDGAIFFFGPEANSLDRLLAAHTFGTIFLVPSIQLFWLSRVWSLSKIPTTRFGRYRIAIVISLAALIIGESAVFLLYGVQMTTHVLRIADATTKVYTTAALVMMSVTDIALTVAITVVLEQNRTGNTHRVDNIINPLIVYTLANGLLTTLLTLATLVSFLLQPLTWVWMAVFIVQERLYVNSLLASLNMRTASQDKPHVIDLSELAFEKPPTRFTNSTPETMSMQFASRISSMA